MDAVIYSKVLTPEFKPDYYSNLQDIFGCGQVKNMTDFMEQIVEYMPYSESDDGGINVMKNVLEIQDAIDRRKKIKFKLEAYRYEEEELHLKPTGDQNRCVSPFQIMMSNGRYYLMAKKVHVSDFLFYRIDLMSEIQVLDNLKSEEVQNSEWINPQKFITANPYFYSGMLKEDVIIGFEEEQVTQIVDWFGAQENGLYEILGTYYSEKQVKNKETDWLENKSVKMVRLKLVKKYHNSHCEDKEVLITIRKAVDASPELRSKKALIENFINGINDVDDIMLEWNDFVANQRENDLQTLISEEKLRPEETRKFLDNAFREGEVKIIGTDIDKIMPPVSRFGGGNRATKKENIIKKIKAFFEKYFGIGGTVKFTIKETEEH